ncbi:MAG: hypothetical protein KA285_01740 [Bacteroidia bacterium]|nr:hypothetical protein [Bacteroidia bacterium]
MRKIILLCIFVLKILPANSQSFKVEYLGFDGLATTYKRYMTWGLGYHREFNDKLTVGLNYRSYYGFIPPHDREFDQTTDISFDTKASDGSRIAGDVSFFRDISWYEIFYSSRYYFHSVHDNGLFIEESIGYYHLKSIIDIYRLEYNSNTVSADKSTLGDLEQVDILVPLSLHLGVRGYVETMGKNDLGYDFSVGMKYILNDANPTLQNSFFREYGETIELSKLSLDIAIPFTMLF